MVATAPPGPGYPARGDPVTPQASAGPGAGLPRSGTFKMSLLAEQAATWPETGIGILYLDTRSANVCLSGLADYYVAVHADNIAGTRVMNMGDIVLTPGFRISREQLRTLAGHEARHRPQWAVLTVIGGP